MNLDTLENILISKNTSVKEFPFDEKTMVFKVSNKMFALVRLQKNPLQLNLKCDPNDALAYRDIYDCVKEGYHMNKKHWNTITLDGTMPKNILIEMINDSYDLVVNKLTKKEKEKLKG